MGGELHDHLQIWLYKKTLDVGDAAEIKRRFMTVGAVMLQKAAKMIIVMK
jgi:hypothetical protein